MRLPRPRRRLSDSYRFPGFRPLQTVVGIFGDPGVRVVTLVRRSKKRPAACAAACTAGFYDRTVHRVRDLPCGGLRIVLEIELRRVACRTCGAVKRERLDFLADNPRYTKRFAFYVGRRCRASTIKDIAEELQLDWHTVKDAREAVHARAAAARRHARAEGHRHRRGVDPEGAHLPDRRERPRCAGGRSGSAARTAPRPAWTRSSPGSGPRKARGFAWR